MSNQSIVKTRGETSSPSDYVAAAHQAASDAIEEGKDAVVSLRKRISPWVTQVKDRAVDNAQVVDRYVHTNAWTVVGVAAVTSAAVAWYLSSRKH